MTISSEVADLRSTANDAVVRGLTAMGVADTSVTVTRDFVSRVQAVTADPTYNANRGAGEVAARTCTTPSGEVVIVINWNAFAEKSDAELERLLAHEGAHVLILQRAEDAKPAIDAQFDDEWNFNLAMYGDIALEEYRCESAVFAAGYPVETSRTDPEIEETLTNINIETLKAKYEYDTVHQDPRTARNDVLGNLAYTTRTLACLAARHLHADEFKPKNLSQTARAHWVELVAPTWTQLLHVVRNVPDAVKPWPAPAPERAALAMIPIINILADSFGFKGEPEAFWLTMDDETFERRLARANSEYDPNT